MRDLALFATLIILIPFILRRPWIGVLAGAVISLMVPHRTAYGAAYDFPFALVVAIVMVVGIIFGRQKITFPRHTIVYLMMMLMVWFAVTLLFALEPDSAYPQWVNVMKVFVLILMSAFLIHTRTQINAMVWMLVISIGWFGVKGGVFTILGGGESRVYGPTGGSYVSDNNSIAVALVMVVPLMFYLSTTAQRKYVKAGLFVAAMLSFVAVLGTQSRGALLAVGAMSLFLWLKSRRKVVFGVVLFGALAGAVMFMPDAWDNRMRSMENYEEDASAQGRLNTWRMAFNLANDRPLVGGGFEMYTPNTFARYAPNPEDVHSAHSVYFQMLGEHGYVGLGLFLSLGIMGWITARRVIARSRDAPENLWAANLARSMQVSLIGFAVGGAFINISYWDLQYYELLLLVATERLVAVKAMTGGQANPAATNARGVAAS
jgi:putative inorganic carbon (hco3(-)) transporter